MQVLAIVRSTEDEVAGVSTLNKKAAYNCPVVVPLYGARHV